MKKNSKKARLKVIVKFLAIQIAIIVLSFLWISESMPVNIDDCLSESIRIEEVHYRSQYREYRVVVCGNAGDFVFPNLGRMGDFTGEELYRLLKAEDALDIKYCKENSLFGQYNLVVDARGENKVYLNPEKFKKETVLIVAAGARRKGNLLLLSAVLQFFLLLFANFLIDLTLPFTLCYN